MVPKCNIGIDNLSKLPNPHTKLLTPEVPVCICFSNVIIIVLLFTLKTMLVLMINYMVTLAIMVGRIKKTLTTPLPCQNVNQESYHMGGGWKR